MNDEKLDRLLNEAMRVSDAPDLWPRISPSVSGGLSWREVRWACGVAAAVLLAWAATPPKAVSVQRDWEPVALKQSLREQSVTAAISR